MRIGSSWRAMPDLYALVGCRRCSTWGALAYERLWGFTQIVSGHKPDIWCPDNNLVSIPTLPTRPSLTDRWVKHLLWQSGRDFTRGTSAAKPGLAGRGDGGRAMPRHGTELPRQHIPHPKPCSREQQGTVGDRYAIHNLQFWKLKLKIENWRFPHSNREIEKMKKMKVSEKKYFFEFFN